MSAPRHPYRFGRWMLAVFVSLAMAIANGDLARLRISVAVYIVDPGFEVLVPTFAFALAAIDDGDHAVIGCMDPVLRDDSQSLDGEQSLDDTSHNDPEWFPVLGEDIVCRGDDPYEPARPRKRLGLVSWDDVDRRLYPCLCAPDQTACLDMDLRAVVDAYLRGSSEEQFRDLADGRHAVVAGFAHHLSGYAERDHLLSGPLASGWRHAPDTSKAGAGARARLSGYDVMLSAGATPRASRPRPAETAR